MSYAASTWFCRNSGISAMNVTPAIVMPMAIVISNSSIENPRALFAFINVFGGRIWLNILIRSASLFAIGRGTRISAPLCHIVICDSMMIILGTAPAIKVPRCYKVGPAAFRNHAGHYPPFGLEVGNLLVSEAAPGQGSRVPGCVAATRRKSHKEEKNSRVTTRPGSSYFD